MENNRRGFTLVELLVGIMIMGIMMGVATIGVNSFRQTTKQEAKKVAFYLESLLVKSGSRKMGFTATFGSDTISAVWDNGDTPEPLKASGGLTYLFSASTIKILYSKDYAVFTSADNKYDKNKQETTNYNSVEINGSRQESYYVIIASPKS